MPLSPPPVDAEGVIIPHNHPEVMSNHPVVHRVHKEWTVPDKGVVRLSSMAFKSSTRGKYPGMSVDLVCHMEDAGIDPKALITKDPLLGSIVFTAGDLRAAGYKVGSEPVDGNLFHGEVWGDFKLADRVLRALAQWYVPLPNVQIAHP